MKSQETLMNELRKELDIAKFQTAIEIIEDGVQGQEFNAKVAQLEAERLAEEAKK